MPTPPLDISVLNEAYRVWIQCNRNTAQAAKIIGIPRQTLYCRVKKAEETFNHREPNILYLDVETSQALGGFFGLYDQNIGFNNVIQDWFMISAQWSWNDEEEINTVSVLDGKEKLEEYTYLSEQIRKCLEIKNAYKSLNKIQGLIKKFHEIKIDDRNVLTTIKDVIDSADIVVTHNGDKFDIKKINARIISLGIEPLSYINSIDTLKEARKVAKFSSNKLGDLCNILGLNVKKLTVEEPNAWIRATQGDEKAIASIVKYGEGDIPTLRNVYKKLKPYMKGNTFIQHFNDSHTCAHCGSSNIVEDKLKYTKTNAKITMKCLACGGISELKKHKKR